MLSKSEIKQLMEAPTSECDGCFHARHREQTKAWECVAHPPTVQPLIQVTAQGPQLMGTISVFPSATIRCGEFSPMLAIANLS